MNSLIRQNGAQVAQILPKSKHTTMAIIHVKHSKQEPVLHATLRITRVQLASHARLILPVKPTFVLLITNVKMRQNIAFLASVH
jgi:hypothetical protein